MNAGHDSSRHPFAGVSLEHRLAELTILYEVSRALQKTQSRHRALRIILAGVTAGPGLGFNRAFVLLVDDEQKVLHGCLAVGPESPEAASTIWRELTGKHRSLGEMLDALDGNMPATDLHVNDIVARFRLPLEETDHPLLKILRSHEAAHAENGIFKPHGFPVDPATCELLGSRAFAVAPLFLADRNLGLLIADNAITQRPVAGANLRLLQIFAQEASAAIENTLLYEQLRQQIALHEMANQELRSNQERLLRAERLSTMGKMAALLAHEIRTPLVAIGGFARRLLRTCAPDDPKLEEMGIIVSEVARLERLVGEVLGYSKMAKPRRTACNVNNLIESVVNNMQEEIDRSRVAVRLELACELRAASLDEAQMRQALLNLVNNALEAMPSGGTLTVSTRSESDYLEIAVRDTGVGIMEEHWNKLFTPFFTTKSSGTGLGLVIVAQVVDNHQGSLGFDSRPGDGTTFNLRIPLSPGGDAWLQQAART